MSTINSGAPTVNDLKTKLCWICREEEIRQGSETARPNDKRVWVHPCTCTLIAHEACLLEWIREAQRSPSRAQSALKCPQCGTKYAIESHNPLLLRAMNYLDRTLTTSGTFVTVGLTTGLGVAFVGSIYGLCLYYGSHAVRIFVGERTYDLIVGDNPERWSWVTYWHLPLVPFYLVLSHMGPRYESLVLTPIRLPLMFSMLFPNPTSLAVTHTPISLPTFLLGFPPTPAVLAIIYPWARLYYEKLRDRLTKRVLGSVADPVPENNDNGAAAELDGGILGADLRIILDLQDAVQGQQQQPEQQQRQGAQQGLNDGGAAAAQNADANGPPAAAAQRRDRRVRLTFSSFGRFLAGALLKPWIGAIFGKGLEIVARRFHFLRVFLGVDHIDSQRMSWMTSVIQDTPLTNLGYRTPWRPRMTWPLEPMDNIFWRNTVGLSLWIVARDAVSLLHLYLKKRELQSRRILSRSFAGVDVTGLDLITPVAV